jgi:hypothetical protein
MDKVPGAGLDIAIAMTAHERSEDAAASVFVRSTDS